MMEKLSLALPYILRLYFYEHCHSLNYVEHVIIFVMSSMVILHTTISSTLGLQITVTKVHVYYPLPLTFSSLFLSL